MSDYNTLMAKYGAMTSTEALEKVEYLNTLNANQAERMAGLEAELAAARADLEKLQRVLAATEAQSNRRFFRQIFMLMEQCAQVTRERDSLQQHCELLTGMKFSDRMHAALVARAEGAEAERDALKALLRDVLAEYQSRGWLFPTEQRIKAALAAKGE